MIDFLQLIHYLPEAFFAFFLTLALVLFALKFFPKMGLMDRPWKYGLKRSPIPYYGGVVLYIGFMISCLLFVPMSIHLAGVLAGATLIAVVSFLDDRFALSPWLRLGVQVVAALVLVFSGVGIKSLSNPFGGALPLDNWQISLGVIGAVSVLAMIFTVVWVVMLVNTMNFLDGLNGLPSGVTVIAALSLFLLSIRPGIHFDANLQIPVAMMSIILFACTLAFWIFDFYPAKILMGDTGSMFLGFILASLAIFSGGKVATAVLVMGFPILDAFWVIIRRILKGQSPMKGDLKHLHHRLVEIGYSERMALFMIYSLCAIFGLAAVFLDGMQKVYAISAMLMMMVIIGGVAVYLGSKRSGKKEGK